MRQSHVPVQQVLESELQRPVGASSVPGCSTRHSKTPEAGLLTTSGDCSTEETQGSALQQGQDPILIFSSATQQDSADDMCALHLQMAVDPHTTMGLNT